MQRSEPRDVVRQPSGCKTAINKTSQSELYYLHDIGWIKRFLNRKKNSIVQAIAMPRIDYCNSLLYGVAATNLRNLQWVQNAAFRLVCSLHCQDMNTSHRHLYVFTGCRLSLESISRLLCSVSSAFMGQVSKKHGRQQEDFDIQPPLEHQYPVGRPFRTIEKNAWR